VFILWHSCLFVVSFFAYPCPSVSIFEVFSGLSILKTPNKSNTSVGQTQENRRNKDAKEIEANRRTS